MTDEVDVLAEETALEMEQTALAVDKYIIGGVLWQTIDETGQMACILTGGNEKSEFHKPTLS